MLFRLIVVVPTGVINPFAAIVGLVSRDTTIWQSAAPMFGGVALAPYMVHILERHKAAVGRDDQRE